MVSSIGLIILVGMIWWGRVEYRQLWRDNPWNTLGLCAILGVLFGVSIMDAWYWVPEAYVPDEAMISRIRAMDCQTPRCERIVNDLLDRVKDK